MGAILDQAKVSTTISFGFGSPYAVAEYLGELATLANASGAPAARLRRIADLLRAGPGATNGNSPTLEVRTFGGFQLRGAGGWTDGPPARKGGHLVQRLVTSPSRSVTREELLPTDLSDVSIEQALHRLHLAASGARAFLRRFVGDVDLIRTTRVGYSLCDNVLLDLDVSRFTAAYQQHDAEAYNVAVGLYRGEFLAGETSDWIRPIRVRCAAMYVDMLAELARIAFEGADLRAALHHSLAAGAADRGHEGAARIAMRCFAALGQRAPILGEYDSLQTYLREQFGAEPSKETRALYYSLVR